MKVVITGNCQARPISRLFEESQNFIVVPPIVLHLSSQDDFQRHLEAFEWADFIFAQRTDNNFPYVLLRSEELKERYSNKVIVWPNIFFSGQQPYLRYITHRTAGRILGPFEAMHDLRIFFAWLAGQNAAEIKAHPFGADYAHKVAELSLEELRDREKDCDIIISDVILSERTKKLFFTFNHPTRFLLKKVFDRMLESIGAQSVEPKDLFDEPLGMYRVPSTWDSSEVDICFRGREFFLEADKQIRLGKERTYTSAALHQAFFECYSHLGCFEDMQLVRFTPNLLSTQLVP